MVQPLFGLLVCCCCFGGGRKVAFGATHCVTSTDSTAMREKDVFNIMSWCINSVHNITNTVIVLSLSAVYNKRNCEMLVMVLVNWKSVFACCCLLTPFLSIMHTWVNKYERKCDIWGGKRSVLFHFFNICFPTFVCLSFFGLISWGLLLFYCNLLACVVTLIFVR